MTVQDPFSAAPEDEAQTEQPKDDGINDAPPWVTKVDPPKVKVVSPPADEGKITVTLKGGSGHDSPWVVIHATDVEDAYDHFIGDNSALLAKLMEQVQRAGKYFTSLGAGPQPSPQQSAPPAGAQEAPGGEKRFCSHGEMRFKSDVSKAGKAYSGFFCSERDRNNQCKAQFL